MNHIFQSLNLDYNTISVLNIGDKQGFTGYIDFINISDFPENEYIMKGMDVNGRPFLTLKLNVNGKYERYSDDENSDNEKEIDEEEKKLEKIVKKISYPIVVTIFQRYSDSEKPIVLGTRYPFGIFWPDTLIKSGFETELCISRINNLLKGEVINDIEYFNNYINIDKSTVPKYGLLRITIDQVRNKILKQVEDIICSCMYKDISLVVKEYL